VLDLTRPQLQALMAEWGEPGYRADQLWGWLYRSLATSFDEMTNLPQALRSRLADEAQIELLTPVTETLSGDQMATKVLFRLADGQAIESVLMHYQDEAARDDGRRPAAGHSQSSLRRSAVGGRRTVCVSTQAGCAMGCPFCATGQMGLARNLTTGEIVSQVLYFDRLLHGRHARVTNLVFMGMGEPMANFEATWQAIQTLNDPAGFGLGARRMTLSTVGLVPGIERLSRSGLQVNLAVSLHAPNDALRNQLVPVNKRFPLAQLMAAGRDYIEQTGRRLTIEYVLIDGVNDSLTHARELAGLLAGMLVHVNLIPLNPTPDNNWRPTPPVRAVAFREVLVQRGIPATLRRRRGIDIQAGCGQLRAEVVRRARERRTAPTAVRV
jgi:23S rRNA (adenine2503-C2)-methyltransferase